MTTTASTLSVITDGNAFSVVVRGVALFTDAGLTVPVVFPQSVSADVTWYAAALTRPGVRQIEVLVTASDGTSVPVPTVQGLPATVDCAEGVVDYSGPASSGGSSPGAPVVRKFAFDLTTPNLDTGVDLYVPTIGDILLDAWIEIDVGFDGTTPKADLAQDWAASGLFVSATQRTALPVDFADNLFTGGGLLGGGAALLSLAEASATAGITTPIAPANIGQRTVPAKFVSADPVQLVVSQNGTPTGGPVGGAAGSGVVYLVTVTPV